MQPARHDLFNSSHQLDNPGPKLRFTPSAWAKLLYWRDRGDTEVGGFGVASEDDLLLVQDVVLVRQRCTATTVKFDDAAVADYFDEQVDAGRKPESFARIWVHTHPGESAHPSSTDEATFARCFGEADWALMFILAAGGEAYARMCFNVGPGGSLLLPVEVDFAVPFPAADQLAWDKMYTQLVEPDSSAWKGISTVNPWEEREAFADAWQEYLRGSDSELFMEQDEDDFLE